MTELDRSIMVHYMNIHGEKAKRYNFSRHPKVPFQEGDLVWVFRSQPVTSQKLESWWLGPAKVSTRVGADSYHVIHKPGEIWEAH